MNKPTKKEIEALIWPFVKEKYPQSTGISRPTDDLTQFAEYVIEKLVLDNVSKCCDTCNGELNTKVSYHPCPNCGELSK